MSWTHTRSKIANVKRKDPEADVTELRRQLKCERASEYICEIVDAWPPLTDEQRTRLGELLKPVRINAHSHPEDWPPPIESRRGRIGSIMACRNGPPDHGQAGRDDTALLAGDG